MPKKTVDHELKRRFLAVFAESGMGQEEFGRSIDQPQNAISQVVSGPREPSRSMLRAVITKYDISPAWLYSGIGNMKSAGGDTGQFITRKEYDREIGALEGQLKALRETLERYGEVLAMLRSGSRPSSLPEGRAQSRATAAHDIHS